jgi:hypothetical protein
MRRVIKPGDWVIYRKRKYSVHPTPHARFVMPASNGDEYSYEVDKFWIVVDVQPDHQIVACTRRGKRVTVNAQDPALWRARWWERLLFRNRFPNPAAVDSRESEVGTSET